MSELTGRLKTEHKTLTAMARIYCGDHHVPLENGLCPECGKLMGYAEVRLAKCPYGQAKPTCTNCPIHCYKPRQREEVRQVMRYAGPRMALRHPWLSFLHLLDKYRKARHPMELRGKQKPDSAR
jgi:hypothetical protein